MSVERQNDLPSFERPPVHEVAVGIGFHPLSCWTATAAGEFRPLVLDKFPKVEDKPPLAPMPTSLGAGLELDMMDLPPLRRVWFVSEDDSTLIQVQDDRLHVNWRRTSDDAEYPRYEHVLEHFAFALKCLMKFCEERGEHLKVTGGEVTYVNHIYEGELWHSWDDLSRVFAQWNLVPQNIGTADALSTVITYDGGKTGTPFVSAGHHMSIEAKAALRAPDKSKVLIFQLVNRGSIESDQFEEISNWLGVASSDIVKGFTKITSDDAHRYWEKK